MCESVPLEAHSFELTADLALLEGACHAGDTALQAVLHAIHLLKHVQQLCGLHSSPYIHLMNLHTTKFEGVSSAMNRPIEPV